MSTSRCVKRSQPRAKTNVPQMPSVHLSKQWLMGSLAGLLLVVCIAAWRFAPANTVPANHSSLASAAVALTSFSEAPAPSSTMASPIPSVADAFDKTLPLLVPAQQGDLNARYRSVVNKKTEGGNVTLTLKEEDSGQLAILTAPIGTNVVTRERDGQEQVLSRLASLPEHIDYTRAEFASTGIQNIKKGDTVVTRNSVTGKTELKKVARTFARAAYEIVKLELTDVKTDKIAETLRGTPEHPFFTPSGMIAMGELKPGMKVITRRGPPLVVKSTVREKHPKGIPVYNFEVEDDHTYFVGKSEGGAWVHNTCGRFGTPRLGTTEVPLDQLNALHPVPRPGVPANHIDDLMNSIKTKGYDVGQAIPIVRMPDGRLVTLGGHHRVEAMRQLGETTIPGRIVDWNSLSEAVRRRWMDRFPDFPW